MTIEIRDDRLGIFGESASDIERILAFWDLTKGRAELDRSLRVERDAEDKPVSASIEMWGTSK